MGRIRHWLFHRGTRWAWCPECLASLPLSWDGIWPPILRKLPPPPPEPPPRRRAVLNGLFLALLLSAHVAAAQSTPTPPLREYPPEDVAAIEQTPIGGKVTPRAFTVGCNTCRCELTKISDTEVREEGCACTLVGCGRPTHRFKPEPAAAAPEEVRSK